SNGHFTPFLFAARQGKMEAVKALLAAGADVNEELPLAVRGTIAPGPSALVLAVASGHFELAAFLLDNGADPNAAAHGWTALHQITWTRRPGVGDNSAGPTGSGNVDSLEIVRKLVAHGTNINARITKVPRSPTQGECGFELFNCVLTDLNMIGATPFLM